MSTTMITIIASVALFLFGIIFAMIGFWIKRTILKRMDERETAEVAHREKMERVFKELQEKIESKINELEDKVTGFKEEMLKDYVRKEDFSKNDLSHKELWTELNKMKERVTKVETKEETR